MEITIERLGHLGDGIGPGPNGAPVFVPMALPGEVVTGALNGQTMDDMRIVTPSALRVSPICRHFKTCGGCLIQHAREDFVSDWKAGIVRAALAAQGLTADISGVATSPAQSRRRATLAIKRNKSGATVGFHARASQNVIDVPDCQLLHPAIMAGFDHFAELAVIGGSRKAVISLTVTVSESGLDLSVTGGKSLDTALRIELPALAERAEFARLVWDGELLAERAAPWQGLGRAKVSPPPGAFLQATREGEAALVADVMDHLAKSKRVADLFCGVGTFALNLAQNSEVLGIESEVAMVQALDQGWRNATNLKAVKTVARDLFRRPLMADEFKGYDGVVIDPPRAGAEAQVRELATTMMPRLSYVSCNPVTFARDAKILVDAGYRLGQILVVDQFRWSAHVEISARFTRDAG